MLTQEQLAAIESVRRASGGFLPAREVAKFAGDDGTIEQFMLDLIPLAKTFAIPPISNFFVGVVALGAGGNLYFGANYEFPGHALSFSIHGEQAATVQALSNGETGIAMLAISAAPCGYCRQFLNELTSASTLKIVLPNTPATTLTSLLPAAFGPSDLGVDGGLLSPQSHGLKLAADDLAQAALDAANNSYAPYSASYAGVALKTSDGGIFAGSVAENAAFNPSMSPLEAAIVRLVISGGKTYADIVDAVLVEVRDAKASQAGVTREILSSITNVDLRVYEAS
ncbi:MAG: cytidine deaminase [Thermoanaerobaculia bacterium]|jgi:cytidine deaminase|nr:cytidine deaminase [Thermoanaerobaculia bacterium]